MREIFKKGLHIIFLSLTIQNVLGGEDHLPIIILTDQKVYVTGERIWINGVITQKTNEKYLLVELLDRNGNQKSYSYLNLTNNRFSGYIKTPTDIKSDFYFLHYARQFEITKEKVIPLLIINPQSPLDTCTYKSVENIKKELISNSNNSVSIIGLKNEYGTNEKVNFEIKSDEEITDFSLFVTKKDQISEYADSIFSRYEPIIKISNILKADLSSQVIKLKLTSAVDGIPVADIKVWSSVIGKKSRLSSGISKTNGEIIFYFPIIYGQSKIVFSVDTSFKQPINMELMEEKSAGITIEFPCLSLKNEMKDEIEERLLNIQLQEKFALDSTSEIIFKNNDTTEFYGNAKLIYHLDDYVRFPDLRDVFKEIIPEIRIKNAMSDNPVFQILDQAKNNYFEKNALILLDGVVVYNYKGILDFDALKIKTIEVVDRKFYLGKDAFNGIIHFKTYTHDLAGFLLPERDIIYPLNGVQVTAYPAFESNYKDPLNKLPEFRNLLYREVAHPVTSLKSKKIEFSAKNSPGMFEIDCRLLSTNGLISRKIAYMNVKSIK